MGNVLPSMKSNSQVSLGRPEGFGFQTLHHVVQRSFMQRAKGCCGRLKGFISSRNGRFIRQSRQSTNVMQPGRFTSY